MVYYYRGLSRIEVNLLKQAVDDFKIAQKLGENDNADVLAGLG